MCENIMQESISFTNTNITQNESRRKSKDFINLFP